MVGHLHDTRSGRPSMNDRRCAQVEALGSARDPFLDDNIYPATTA